MSMTHNDDRNRNASSGIIVKGDYNMVYASTIFNVNPDGKGGLEIPTGAVPGRSGWLANSSNRHSQFFNVATVSVGSSGRSKSKLPNANNTLYWKSIYVSSTGGLGGLGLAAPASFDFRPSAASPLRGAGTPHQPWTPPPPRDGGVDAGAYQFGEDRWIPGCQFLPECTSYNPY